MSQTISELTSYKDFANLLETADNVQKLVVVYVYRLSEGNDTQIDSRYQMLSSVHKAFYQFAKLNLDSLSAKSFTQIVDVPTLPCFMLYDGWVQFALLCGKSMDNLENYLFHSEKNYSALRH
jgi:hypothetical protein